MNTQTNNAANTVRRIQTLGEHRAILKHVFDTAKERVLIVSPFVSNSALSADSIPSLVASAVSRNVRIAIYVDDQLNRESGGAFKKSAEDGISSLVTAGADVTIVNGIHNKTLARDTDLIAEGSFNWLSAVRTAGGTHQREERTMIVEGVEVASMIEKELSGLAGQGGSLKGVHPEEIKIWTASGGHWFFACVLLALSAAIISAHMIAGIAAFCGVFRYMFYLLKPHSYTVREPGLIDTPTAAGEDDEPLADLTASRFTAGYVGIFDRR